MLSQYSHTRWTSDDYQVPFAGVSAIAQTRDGYLWVGDRDRLFRFDGVRFVAVEAKLLPGARISALIGSRDGALWLGSTGGLQVLEGTEWSSVSGPDGKSLASVYQILEDRSGAIWAYTRDRDRYDLIRVAGRKVARFTTQDGVPNPIGALFEDRGGRLWIGSDNGPCLWSGTGKGSCFPSAGQVVAMAEGPGRGLVVADASRGRLVLVGESGTTNLLSRIRESTVPAVLLLGGSESAIWVGTLGRGLIRLANQRVEPFRRADGLSGDLVTALFEDREGNVWVGTATGLDRFRRPRFQRYTNLEGLSGDLVSAIACTKGGVVWVGTFGGLNRLVGNSIETTKFRLPSANITSLYADRAGKLWVGTTEGVVYESQHQFGIAFEIATNRPRPLRFFTIVETARGVWFNDANERLLRLDPGSKVPRTIKLPDRRLNPGSDGIYRLEPAADGGLWIGYYRGGIGKLSANDNYSPVDSEGIAGGPLYALHEDHDGALWVGTQTGLRRYRDGAWASWDSSQGIPEGGIRGIVEDRAGGIYLLSAHSVFYLRASTRRALAPGRRLAPDSEVSFDRSLEAEARSTGPRFALSDDGRLWIGSDQGLVLIPSPAVPRPRPPPPVSIENVTSDHRPITPAPHSSIILKGAQLDFQYTALSLTYPERITFRYALEGFSPDWSDVGSRRVATYTNLSPGNYRFCVTAANEEQAWNPDPACQPFRIEPHFYQTWIFLALIVLSTMLALWTAYNLRVRQVRNRFGLVLQERMRVARELHDTLLQGFAGISYQLDAAYRQIEVAPESSKVRIEKAMDQADRAMGQARQAISMLRLSALDMGLAAAISTAGAQLTDETGIQFKLMSERLIKNIPYPIEGTLYMLACEAIHNAVKHAAPRHIQVTFSCRSKGVQMVIADDGRGFDMSDGLAKKGHWGLQGMAERARSIGIVLSIHSAPGEGTRVAVKVPAPLLSVRTASYASARSVPS